MAKDLTPTFASMKYSTNIKCGGCIAAVTPALDAAVGSGNWKVELENPLKVLSFSVPESALPDIPQVLAAVGYKAEALPA
jgi:copper chaperone